MLTRLVTNTPNINAKGAYISDNDSQPFLDQCISLEFDNLSQDGRLYILDVHWL